MTRNSKAKKQKKNGRQGRRERYLLNPAVELFEHDEHHTKFSTKELGIMILLEASILGYFTKLFWGASMSFQKTIMNYQWAKLNMLFALIILLVLGYNTWSSSRGSLSTTAKHAHSRASHHETPLSANEDSKEADTATETDPTDRDETHECTDKHHEHNEEEEEHENDSDHQTSLTNLSEGYEVKLQQLQQDYSNIQTELEKERDARIMLEQQEKQREMEREMTRDGDLTPRMNELIKSQKETLLSKMKKSYLNLNHDDLEDNKMDANGVHKELDETKKTHGQLREEIIKRQFAPNVRIRFPNAKDLVCLFEDMRVNAHTHLHYFVFVMLEKQADLTKASDRHTLAKSLLRQSCQWLWDMLMDCYSEMQQYEAEIYHNIGHALSIHHTIRENGIYEREEVTTKSHAPKLTPKKREVLKFTVGHYLQQNYESLLHAPLSDHSKSKLTFTVDKIAHKYNQKMTFLDCLNDQEKEQLKELTEDYLKYACEVCWLMILQDVTMSLTPTEFQPKETVIFDDKLHIRYYGSENVPHVSYFVWPAVKRGDALFDTLPFVVTGFPTD